MQELDKHSKISSIYISLLEMIFFFIFGFEFRFETIVENLSTGLLNIECAINRFNQDYKTILPKYFTVLVAVHARKVPYVLSNC